MVYWGYYASPGVTHPHNCMHVCAEGTGNFSKTQEVHIIMYVVKYVEKKKQTAQC